ncbi:dehydrogenase [Fulvimarina pelagi HTCC2506]|uniref:Dehydrogenase n=1 Tax=Fulvimarina pelagi HTCC2506 TaxID=314231 RepID=Q0G394_9HYPH|nr:PQQ-dependent sugar dehydrogenase [Fulvimarina pelagi]EAU41937.1 dehydrogenase [Fulvimarina pelagi HTCC2506]
MTIFRKTPIACLLAGSAFIAAVPAMSQETLTIDGNGGTTLTGTPLVEFDEPWAMTFLPDGSMLVTEKAGALMHVTLEGEKTEVGGVPAVAYGGQGGLGDVVLHPDFAENDMVYLSFAEEGDGGYGAAVARGTLDRSGEQPALRDVEVIWRQDPKVGGQGHYSHRIAFGPAGSEQEGYMFVTSGDRQKQDPAQEMDVNLGKVLRLNEDGSVPDGNPFADEGGVAAQFWTVGNRNLLGIDFDSEGRLWEIEMGPRGGDELNLIQPGENYGWPEASNGVNYSGVPIPDHNPDEDGFNAPEASWTPVISPASLLIYDGDMFAEWQGDALIGALSGQALVHVALEGDSAEEEERFSWGSRVREIEQGPDGAVWVLEDGSGGRLIQLTPGDEAS